MPRTTIGERLLHVCLLLPAVLFSSWNKVEAKGYGDEQSVPLVWKKRTSLETVDCLPVSIAYSPNGKLLVVGGTGGRVVAIDRLTRKENWKAEVGGDFAAVAFAADGKSILATFDEGVRYLDADTGGIRNFFIEKDSNPTSVGVFPDIEIDIGANQPLISHKIIFGNARGWFVKNWTASGFPGTITTATVPPGAEPADLQAVPLAVDPEGRSVIVTGPRRVDGGQNVLWAWTAGDSRPNSPGNRILKGHQAMVVSAAWSKDGKAVATGDATGNVILWDARSMQPTDHQELGARIAAVALSPDGTKVAVVAIGKRAEFFAWEKAKPKNRKLIHVDSTSFAGSVHACLAFSPDGQQLAGSAIALAARAKTGKATGQVHVWECGKP